MKFLRGLLTHNIWWKLVSLAAAVGVWMNIAGEPQLATILSAPVEYKNYPKDLEISSDIVESIDVEARAASGQLRDLTDARVTALVDFSTVQTPGVRTVTLTARELNLPRGIELIRTIPAQLQFRFERRKTRVLKVRVPFSGALPAGFRLAGYDVLPLGLSIAGPESRVDAAGEAVCDPFDLTGVARDKERTLAVYVAEPQVRFLSPPQVTVKVRVKSLY